jgi:hypothetical protein
MDDPDFISLVPTLNVFLLAVIIRRPIESLISGSLVGLGIIHGTQFIGGFGIWTIQGDLVKLAMNG